MKRETYKGRKIKVVAGRGADWGYTRITLNGVDMGKWMQSEDESLRSTRGTIDHADEVGAGSGRYGAEWYAPGTFELCDEGHPKEIGGVCGHHWCVGQRAEAAQVAHEAGEPAEASSVEERRDILRAAVAPRPAAYDVATSSGARMSSIPWGIAMAGAQKSIRAGALIDSLGSGAFVLVSPDGTRRATYTPSN